MVAQANYLADRGQKIVFVTLRPTNQALSLVGELDGRVEYFCLDWRALFDPHSFRKINTLVRSCYARTIYATLDQAIIVSKLLKIAHPGLRLVIRESGVASRKSWRLKLLDLVTNWMCYSIIAVSPEVAESLLAYQSIYEGKIRIVSNGVDLPAPVIRSNRDVLILLHVGSMNNPGKRQSEIIKIFGEIVRRTKEKLSLVLVGDGICRPRLEAQVQFAGLGQKVIFTGLLSPAELSNLYDQADIFLLYSVTEGSPNVVLEAMAHGLPILSTRIPGVNECVLDQATGLLSDEGQQERYIDNLLRMISDRGLRLSLGEAGRKRVMARFLLGHTIAKLEPILLFD